MTGNELRRKVADIINAWDGATRGSAKHLEILNIYNNHKPLARGYPVQVNDAYCATTTSAAYIKAGIAEYTGTECGVGKYVEIAKKKGIWTESDAHTPKVGDACVYDWQDGADYATTDNTGAPDHIGIVAQVGGGTFVVTEGNMNGGKVGKRTMKVNGRYIRGFITPDFDMIAKELCKKGAKEAIKKLHSIGVINSPGYWEQMIVGEKVKYLDALLIKSAGKIEVAGTRTGTPEQGVDRLARAKIIDAPSYWIGRCRAVPNLGELMRALGGAV